MRELDHIRKNLDKIEEAIFSGKESLMVKEISIARRDILNFHRTIKPEHQTLRSLEEISEKWFGKETKPLFSDLYGEYTQVWNLLESYKETIESLQDTNDSLIGNKTNSIMTALTFISASLFSISVVTSIFASSFKFPPEIFGIRIEFLVIFVFIPVILLAGFLYFKRKRWL